MALSAVALLLVPAAAGAASSGEILRAEVNPQWTIASIAGVATRSDACVPPPQEPPPLPGPEEPEEPEEIVDWGGPTGEPVLPDTPPSACGWIPFATLGPGSGPEDCSLNSRRWGSIGEGVQLVWVGNELHEPGSESFDLAQVELENGSEGSLLCLAAVESTLVMVVCPMYVGFPCSPYAILHETYPLDSAVLKVPASAAGNGKPGQSGAAPPPRKHCGARRHGKRHAKKTEVGLGNNEKAGKARHVKRCKAR